MTIPVFIKHLAERRRNPISSLQLQNGSRVAVIGGGPAGSFFSYFLLSMAKQVDLDLDVDIFEPRDFNIPGPQGCNMCGGVLYEALVQNLAVEGINLPPSVVQRGMEYNMLHLDSGTALSHTPRHEKRIAATFRGIGPRGLTEVKGGSLDDYLLQAAIGQGARQIRSRVEAVGWDVPPDTQAPSSKRVKIKTKKGEEQVYDFVAVATGVNTALLKQFENMDFGYHPPKTTKLVVREYPLGEKVVSRYFGPMFHAFLLDIPGLDYGAIIPKGDYITICLLSSHQELHTDTMDIFLNSPAVRRILPPDFAPDHAACLCGPRINVHGSEQPYGDRIVFIGDCGVSRLYKDGIGAAYRTAKTAAGIVIFEGISADAFRKHYLPFCKKMERDNQIGKLLFKMAGMIQKKPFGQRAMVNMISSEQKRSVVKPYSLSMVLWDMLTGGAPYQDVLLHIMHPVHVTRFLWSLILSFSHQLRTRTGNEKGISLAVHGVPDHQAKEEMLDGRASLGRNYQDGEAIVRQGEPGNCMYVIQDGYVEVVKETSGQEVTLAILGESDFFGEMAIFENEVRAATVRAIGPARVLTIDSRSLLRRIHEDPYFAYRLMYVMSSRVRKLGIGYAHFSNAAYEHLYQQNSSEALPR